MIRLLTGLALSLLMMCGNHGMAASVSKNLDVLITHGQPLLYGVTFDKVTGVAAQLTALQSIVHRPAVRIVFDTGQNAGATYLSPVTQYHGVATTMGLLIDSSYMPSYASPAAVTAWTNSYYAALHSVIDIWEIGNEVNGNWLSALANGSDVMPKIAAMYDAIDANPGTVKALTFFYEGEPGEPNNCIAADHGGNDMFTWITTNFQLGLPPASRSAETEKIRLGLNYALISWYPDQCPGENPNWPAVFTRLSGIFPNAAVGFGELGTQPQQNGSAFEKNEITTLYGLRPGIGGMPATYIIGGFWWYFAEEMVPWDQFGLGAVLNAAIQ